jgi:hypothetical protein
MEKSGYRNGRAIGATPFYVDRQRNRGMVGGGGGGVKTRSASVPYVLSTRASLKEDAWRRRVDTEMGGQ